MNISNNIWSQKIVVSPYCRVSTDKDDQVNSLDSQIKYFSSFIKNHPNWTLGEIYYDEGISGTSVKKRKNFNRLIDDALAGRVQFIITKEVSRFARNTVDTLVFTRQLKDRNVGVYFVLDNINTLDSDGELRLTIMASLAQEESRKTSERVKWGQKRRMEQGVVFGHDLLGYSVVNGILIIKPDEAKLVKTIFNKFLEGFGSHSLAQILRTNGAKSRHSKQWCNTTVLKMLRNEKYVGDLCQKKTYTTDFLSHNRKYNRNLDDMVYLKDHHEPIIDRDTWQKVQQELARRSPDDVIKSKHSNRYWCSGKLVCGECGRRFAKRAKKLKNGENIKAWRCYNAACNGRKKTIGDTQVGCDSFAVNEAVLVKCIGETINYVKQNESLLIDEMLSEIKSVQSQSKPINTAELLSKITDLQSLKSKAIDLALKGFITNDDLKRQNDYYDKEITILSNQVDDAKKTNNLIETQVFETQKYIGEINKILSLKEENLLLYKEILNKIILYNDRILTVYFHHLPFGLKFKYKTLGRLKTYTVDILDTEIVT